jgi:arginine metabolism regulation protein II
VNVLTCIETIERITVESNTLAAPLFWPTFIAALEAFDSDTQGRFRTWYWQTEAYGLAAVRTGISVLNDVWEGGPRTNVCAWRDVIERKKIRLMLS